MIEQLQTLMKNLEEGKPKDQSVPSVGLNKATVVSDETMEGIDTHISDMNAQGYSLVSAIGRGNHIMLFWKKI